MSIVRVLSLDGGGIRGLLHAHILNHIEQEVGKPIASLFDLIAGVSTGGLLTLLLTVPDATGKQSKYSAQDGVTFYQKEANKIFSRSWASTTFRWIPGFEFLHNLFFSVYDHKKVKEYLALRLGDTLLSQALTEVLIPTYDIAASARGDEGLRVFSSRQDSSIRYGRQEDFLMMEIALATSAFPVAFPPQRIHCVNESGPMASTLYCLIDGGVVMKDPSLMAYLHAKKRFPDASIAICSLGCSVYNDSYEKVMKHHSPGVLAWLNSLFGLLLGPQVSEQLKVLDCLMKESAHPVQYIRIAPLLSSWQFFSSMDDISLTHIKAIDKIAYNLIHTSTVLKELIDSLKEER